MIRVLLVSVLGVFLLAGCGDSRKPAVQEQTTEAADSDAPSALTMPPGHGGMPPGHGPVVPLGPEVRLGVVTLTAPDTWVRKPQQSSILIAEFSLPGAEGDSADARLTVTAVGGTVEQNVERWKGQFGGNPASESMEELEVSGVTMTLVDLSGTFGDSHMGVGSTVESSGARMKSAIFQAGGTQFIIKCLGPEKTMGERADEFLAFLQSLKPSGSHGMPPGGMPPGMMPPGHGAPAATEEPTAEEPAAEEPATEEPATEEPATEEPATEESATEEPATEEPAAEEPATEEPATEEAATEEPATEEPASEEPAPETPAAEEPASEEPGQPTPDAAE